MHFVITSQGSCRYDIGDIPLQQPLNMISLDKGFLINAAQFTTF